MILALVLLQKTWPAWNLSLADHMHGLVAPQGSPGRWERGESQTCFDQTFDEPVVLLDHILKPQASHQDGVLGLDISGARSKQQHAGMSH